MTNINALKGVQDLILKIAITCFDLFQVGFDAGDGENFFAVPGSQTPDILHIGNSSNFGTIGRWIFRIDQANIDSGGCQVDGKNHALDELFNTRIPAAIVL